MASLDRQIYTAFFVQSTSDAADCLSNFSESSSVYEMHVVAGKQTGEPELGAPTTQCLYIKWLVGV